MTPDRGVGEPVTDAAAPFFVMGGHRPSNLPAADRGRASFGQEVPFTDF